jgi:NitT/TauT family transport system ATP-binding protein
MSASSGVVVLGFIPLLDCAPLVAAAEKGFAADEGIELMLVRETSSANIRDRVVVGHLDAAHMLGSARCRASETRAENICHKLVRARRK